MPNIVVGIVYLEDLATLKFILKKLIRTNSPPPPKKKTPSGEMAIVLGTFTYCQLKFRGLSYRVLLF